MDILYRKLKVGKTLNIVADLTDNLSDAIASATVAVSNANLTAGPVDVAANQITVALTGVSAGSSVITVNYSSATESDCQSFIVNIEGC